MRQPLKVAVIGEYDGTFPPHQATDAALDHAAGATGLALEPSWISTAGLESHEGRQSLRAFSGIWVAPGSPYRSLTGALETIRFAREARIPLLGTCGGFQHVILEYARNVLGFQDARHAEYDPYASRLIVSKLVCSLVGRTLPIALLPESQIAHIYGRSEVEERYYCNFGVNPEYAQLFRSGELRIVGSDAEAEVRVVELAGHPFFIGTLFVPQLQSTPAQPHPIIVSFLYAADRIRSEFSDPGPGALGRGADDLLQSARIAGSPPRP